MVQLLCMYMIHGYNDGTSPLHKESGQDPHAQLFAACDGIEPEATYPGLHMHRSMQHEGIGLSVVMTNTRLAQTPVWPARRFPLQR